METGSRTGAGDLPDGAHRHRIVDSAKNLARPATAGPDNPAPSLGWQYREGWPPDLLELLAVRAIAVPPEPVWPGYRGDAIVVSNPVEVQVHSCLRQVVARDRALLSPAEFSVVAGWIMAKLESEASAIIAHAMSSGGDCAALLADGKARLDMAVETMARRQTAAEMLGQFVNLSGMPQRQLLLAAPADAVKCRAAAAGQRLRPDELARIVEGVCQRRLTAANEALSAYEAGDLTATATLADAASAVRAGDGLIFGALFPPTGPGKSSHKISSHRINLDA